MDRLFDYFHANRKSADVAKERLSILIARDHFHRNKPSFLPALQDELLEVIKRYVDIDQDGNDEILAGIDLALSPQINVYTGQGLLIYSFNGYEAADFPDVIKLNSVQ